MSAKKTPAKHEKDTSKDEDAPDEDAVTDAPHEGEGIEATHEDAEVDEIVTAEPRDDDTPPEDQPVDASHEGDEITETREDDEVTPDDEGFYVPEQPGDRGVTFVKGTGDARHNIFPAGRSPVHPNDIPR